MGRVEGKSNYLFYRDETFVSQRAGPLKPKKQLGHNARKRAFGGPSHMNTWGTERHAAFFEKPSDGAIRMDRRTINQGIQKDALGWFGFLSARPNLTRKH